MTTKVNIKMNDKRSRTCTKDSVVPPDYFKKRFKSGLPLAGVVYEQILNSFVNENKSEASSVVPMISEISSQISSNRGNVPLMESPSKMSNNIAANGGVPSNMNFPFFGGSNNFYRPTFDSTTATAAAAMLNPHAAAQAAAAAAMSAAFVAHQMVQSAQQHPQAPLPPNVSSLPLMTPSFPANNVSTHSIVSGGSSMPSVGRNLDSCQAPLSGNVRKISTSPAISLSRKVNTVPPALRTMQSLKSMKGSRGTSVDPPSSDPLSMNPFLNMRNLNLEELQKFVQQLKEANQHVPQPLALLLSDARRKEEKKNAKRVANRKSACTSRARKKAYVEEMQKANKRLKRHALILSLLPDLVIAITSEGAITFCSAQVERILRHEECDIIGANIMDLLVPESKESLRHLIQGLLQSETNPSISEDLSQSKLRLQNSRINRIDRTIRPVSSRAVEKNSTDTDGVVVVQDQLFPLSVVKVKSKRRIGEEESSGERSSNGNDKTTFSLSSSMESSSSSCRKSNDLGNNNPRQAKRESSSDDSSSEAKNLIQASKALNRNVQMHNAQLCQDSVSHTDDVTGAAVTANNASARLSSLQHRPFPVSKEEKPSESKTTSLVKNDDASDPLTFENLEARSNSSSDSFLNGAEDKREALNQRINSTSDQNRRASTNENSSVESGYGIGCESSSPSPSREDCSSTDESSSAGVSTGRRSKPLAPTCTLSLVCDDLTTVYCEVTSSVRTRFLNDEMSDDSPTAQIPFPGLECSAVSANSNSKRRNQHKNASSSNTDSFEAYDNKENYAKEILLCLRPVGRGDSVGEELRFRPSKKPFSSGATHKITPFLHTSSVQKLKPLEKGVNSGSAGSPVPISNSSDDTEPSSGNKKSLNASESEKSVVESLILMSGNTTNKK